MKNYTTYLLIITIGFLLTGCKSCNKSTPPTPTAPQVIEQQYNPAIDSLQTIIKQKIDSINNLQQQLAKQKNKTAIAESNAAKASDRLQEALNKKDTSAALTYANDVIEEFYNYRQETIYQDSIQDNIIEKQAATISNTRAEAELQAIKYDKLKTAYSAQSIALNEATQQNNKLQKKLKRAKFWGKVAGIGTAAGVVLAGFVFL